ncbi:MAG: T9SS type A sorting domain-containing protein [Bacteroidetes bacterium]|nr:T9SS type A sorting domain-containing protein [Bacteroidota bacterium]
MKRLITLFFLLNVQLLYSQSPCDNYWLNFEDTLCLSHLIIDTTAYPQNIWQIGRPQKPSFDSAYSFPNALITDTLNFYPANNNSVFIIRNTAALGDLYGCRMFQGLYNVQTDSLHDYGRIEFSPDNGTTWVDLINDTIYNAFIWESQKPVLTGNSNGWKYFDVILADIGSVFNVQFGDTLLFRFSFTSDSIPDNFGGLMYDNFYFFQFIEGISEIHFKPVKSAIYPNPSTDIFTLEFDNPVSDQFELAVYDIHSKLILKRQNITENQVVIDASAFQPGIYIYKLTNIKAKKRCWGKFITTK